jgi:tRNA G26 N,N-dimethylase Trm1
LDGILEERETGSVPLGFDFAKMCKNVKVSTPSQWVLYAGLESLGFEVRPSYITPGLYKTTAPIKAVYDLIKSWKRALGEENYLLNVKE